MEPQGLLRLGRDDDDGLDSYTGLEAGSTFGDVFHSTHVKLFMNSIFLIRFDSTRFHFLSGKVFPTQRFDSLFFFSSTTFFGP